MTSTDSLNTLATVECPSSERLKHYLSGWLSDGEAEQVEQHLHSCEHCESAMRQLDVHQETLLQSLQATMVQEPGLLAASTSLEQRRPSDAAVADPSKGGSAVIDEALSKARRLLDTPLEAENDPKPVAWHPTHRDFGCYELLRPLGRGGMGAVYLARHRQLGKQVAIKLLPVMSAEDSDVRTRFDREIRVVGRLNHPSIVAATDAGEIEGTQFLVMEYVPGLDLSRLARLMGRLPVAEACELIRQASLGLSCAHAEGVVHRDIKPSNLMLDDLGRIRILDFGLAQWTVWDEASVDLTTVGQLMGTLDYMAPEQAEAIGAVDYRADLYALGATLFRLLCGRAPLAAAPNQSPLEKLRLLSNHQPPKLSTLCPEAPEELVKLVASLLSRSPSDRPASAAHVAEQLAPFAEGAKLVELLQQAKEKAAASPELMKRTALYEPPFPGAAVPMSSPEPAASSGGRFRTLRRVLLAASLPLMIIAGILIKLELNKGQLIIESDVDNVNVKVLKDGKPVDGIQVNHGTTSTRLFADNYEITIDGPSDGLIIDHDKFTLKNGETVVARIKQVLRLENEAGSEGSSQPGGTVFDGKPLEYWLTVIENERSIERLRSAFGACSVLLTEDTAGLITEKVLAALPEVSPTKLKLSATSDEIRQLDLLAFRLVSLANPGEKWITVMVRELDKHDDSWQSRVVSHLWLNSEADRLSDKNLLPLVEWVRIKLAAETATDAVGRVRAAEGLLRIIQREEAPGDLSSKCVSILDAETTLPLSWWFAKPLRYPEGQNTVGLEECWPNPLHHTVITRAVNALNDGKLQGQELGHALVILKQAETLSPEQKVVLLNCVKRQLVERSASADRLTEFVPVSPSFTLLCLPEVGLSFHVSLPRPPGLCLISFELLNLLQQLDPLTEDADTIQCVRNALPKVEPIFQTQSSSFFSSRRREQPPSIAWPELKMNGNAIDRGQLATYLISEHPLLKALEKTTSEQQPSALISTAAEDPELKKRLDQLRQTKDEKEFMAVLGALKSAKGEAGVRVAKTILEALPALPVKEKTLRAPVEEFDFEVDERALQLIAEACPTQFFKVWCESYDNALSDEWRLRLIAHVFQGLPPRNHSDNKDDMQAFHVWLAKYCKASDAKSDKKKLLHHLGTRLFWADPVPSFQLPVIDALEESPYVDKDWWLAPLRWSPDNSPMDKKRLAAALDAIKDPVCTKQSLAAAAFVIANPGPGKFKFSDAEQSEVHFSIIRQIRRLLDEPNDAICHRVELDNRFLAFRNRAIASDQLNLRITFSPLTSKLPISELLDAYLVTQTDASNAPELRLLADRVLPVQSKIRLRGDSLALWLLTTEINISTLEAVPRILPPLDDSKPKRTPQECSDQLWGVGSKPTEADWLQFCLSYHKALAPYRNEFEAAQKKTEQPRPSPAPSLYNGQPLEHWLDVIGRERSVEGLKVAFEACDALVSNDNSPIITETLLKFLPVLDGELKVLDKEANSYWTLDYEAARLLWKANPGAQFFTLWVKERSESKDEKWSQRLDRYATYGSIKSADDVQPLINWARFVLSGPKSGFFEKDGHPDPAGVQSSAGLLRGMLNNEALRADETFVSTATEILTESPYLGPDWWLNLPLLHRGPQGDRELFPAAYQQNVVRKAIVALQTGSDPALVAQACMILANGVKLDREETDGVLKAVQNRIEQSVQTPEFFAMVHVPESFSSFAVTTVDTKDPLKIGTIQLSVRSSMVQFIPVTDTSLAIQLLNVIASLNGRTTCEPQCRMVLEAARGVFDRVRMNYGKRTERPAVPADRFRGATNRLPIQLLWPELTRTDSDQGQGRVSEVIDSRVKDIWGDYSPTQSDWLQLLILNHSAMEDVVAAELEKSVEQK